MFACLYCFLNFALSSSPKTVALKFCSYTVQYCRNIHYNTTPMCVSVWSNPPKAKKEGKQEQRESRWKQMRGEGEDLKTDIKHSSCQKCRFSPSTVETRPGRHWTHLHTSRLIQRTPNGKKEEGTTRKCFTWQQEVRREGHLPGCVSVTSKKEERRDTWSESDKSVKQTSYTFSKMKRNCCSSGLGMITWTEGILCLLISVLCNLSPEFRWKLVFGAIY